jgi:hypothetical protein
VGSKDKKMIDFYSIPKAYRPEPLYKRLEKERKWLEQLDQNRMQRLAEARKRLDKK